MTDLIGGGGGGGNSRTPTRTPDTLLSQDYFEVVLGLSEGPIEGLVQGVKSPLENFYVGTTPLGNAATGEANFPDFAISQYQGYESDPPIKYSMGGQSSNIQVGVRLATQVPVVRQTPAQLRGQINRLEFRIYFNQLVELKEDGGTFEATAQFRIEYKPSDAANWTIYQNPTSIRGKTTSGAVKDFSIDVPLRADVDWDLRVTKISQDNFGTLGVIVDLTWESVQAISMQPQKFKNLALVHLNGRASNQFSSIPDFAGVYEGMLVRVPSNYNPRTRTYDESVPWNGSFKVAYTNNPAWILYEMCMNERWGLPRYYLTVTTDRYSFYSAAKWCDEMVAIPNSNPPAAQPRFTFNEVFQDAKEGIEALNYIAGAFNSVILDDGAGTIILRTDQLRTPKQIFTPENVQGGEFNYTFTDIATRFNDITSVFINPDLDWSEDRRLATIDNSEEIAANGRIPTEFVAVGCTNVHEAVRRANYHYVTSTTEKSTVSFVTSRFGMFTEPLESIYVADPLSGWSKPGRFKSVANGKIYLRDPIYFPVIAPKVMVVQTFEGLQNITVMAPQSGPNYVLDIVSGVLPVELPQNTVFTIEDSIELGLAKPFKVLSIEEVDGSPDAFKVTALEVNVNKYPDADSGSVSESVKYSYQMPGEPVLPPALVIESGRGHLQIASDGTIVYRAQASWVRPFQAFTEYYQVDYRETGAENWETSPPIYGDSFYCAPLKDNTRYNFRLFAVTPFGKRSTKYLEVLNYLVSGKIDILENVSGLNAQMTPSGWQIKWNVPTFPDYNITELRRGVSVQTWDQLPTFSLTKADRVEFGFLPATTWRMYAKYQDTSKNMSADANFVQWEIKPPMAPVLTAELVFNAPLLTWENAQTTQPIRLYRVKRGDAYATAEVLATTEDLQFTKVENVAGVYRYWVEAEDVAGNLSAASSVVIVVTPSVGDAIKQLQDGLQGAVQTLLNINSGFSDRLLREAIERGTSIQVLQQLVTEGDEQLAQQIEILTAKAVGYIRGNMVFNSGFAFTLEGWTGDVTDWAAVDTPMGRVARSTTLIPAGTIYSREFNAAPALYYTIAADTEWQSANGQDWFGIEYLNSAGVVLGRTAGEKHSQHEFLNESARRIAWSFEGQAPAGTAKARFFYQWEGWTTPGSMGVRMVKVEQGRMPATPYSAEASDIGSVAAIRQEATARASAIEAEAALRETLAVRVNGNEAAINTESVVRASETGQLMARWGINMTVGNKVSGVVMNNNGAQSDFVILTDRFAVAQESDVPGQYKFPFVVGSVNGVSSVGINGDLFVDGTIKGRSIAADTIEATSIRSKSLTSDQIKAGSLTADVINVGFGGNMIPDSAFAAGGLGNVSLPTTLPVEWQSYSNYGSGATFGINMVADFTWNPVGSNSITIAQINATGAGNVANVDQFYTPRFPVVSGQRYEFSVYTGAHRCRVYGSVDFYDIDNNLIAAASIATTDNDAELQGGRDLKLWKRVGVFTTAPANAVSCVLNFRKNPTKAGQTSSYAFFTKPMFCPATPNQAVYSNYSNFGTGTRITPQGISTPNLSAISATIGLLRTSSSGQRSEIDDNGQRTYDLNNVLRTRAGIW